MVPAEDEWDEPPARGLTPEPDFRPVPRPRPKKRRSLLTFAGVLVVAVGVGAGGWYLLHDWLGAAPNGEVPLIRADTSPIKVRPEQPGGMEVPNRDKLVYDAMSGNSERPGVEHLLPPPEAPLPKPAPASGTVGTATEPQASVPPAAAASASPAAPTASPPLPPAPPGKALGQAASTPTPPNVGPSAKDVLTAMQPPPTVAMEKSPAVVASETKPAPAKSPAVAAAGAFQVQLSALRNRQEVDKEWSRLQRRNADLLGNLHLSVMRADLGPGKGVFFRLRAGPLADEQAAKNLCQKLSERKIGCLVVRPEG